LSIHRPIYAIYSSCEGTVITSAHTTLTLSFCSYQNLEECYLSNNLLKSIPPEIGECESLETLWLNNNRLRKLPTELGNLSSLQTLDVSENELTTLPKQLAECELLEQVSISHLSHSAD
jgi:Leucine-rich repeat (LRR) protein